MKNALTKNLGWKPLPLALALASWIAVAREPARATSLPLLGTRHRAAIGITEESDCLARVASAETGRISKTEFGDAVRAPAPVAVKGSSAVPQSGFHQP